MGHVMPQNYCNWTSDSLYINNYYYYVLELANGISSWRVPFGIIHKLRFSLPLHIIIIIIIIITICVFIIPLH